MQDNFEVEVLSLWDGADKEESRLAELKFKFPDFHLPAFWQQTDYLLLLMELDKELQPLADHRFGKDRIRVEAREIRQGSVEVVVTLTAIGGALYAFFKEYKNLREGFLLFIEDVKAISSDLHKIMKRHLKGRGTKDNSNPDKGGRHHGADSL